MKKPLFVLPNTISKDDSKKLSAIGYEVIEVQDFKNIKSISDIEVIGDREILKYAIEALRAAHVSGYTGITAQFGKNILDGTLMTINTKH